MRFLAPLRQAYKVTRLTYPGRDFLNYVPAVDSWDQTYTRCYGSKSSGNSKFFKNRKTPKKTKRDLSKYKHGSMFKRRFSRSSSNITPVALITNADHSRKVALIPINLFEGKRNEGEAFEEALAIVSMLRDHGRQVELFADNCTKLKSADKTFDKFMAQPSVKTPILTEFEGHDEATFLVKQDKSGEEVVTDYISQIPTVSFTTENGDLPANIASQLRDIPVSGMQLNFEMDMTNVKDALLNPSNLPALPSRARNLENSTLALSTNVRLDSTDTKTVPLHFNALIQGIVEVNPKEFSNDKLRMLKVPQFNEYVTAIAANLCSTALQRGFPTDVSRKFYSTNKTPSDNDVTVKNMLERYDQFRNERNARKAQMSTKSNNGRRFNEYHQGNDEVDICSKFTSTPGLLDCNLYQKSLEVAARKRKETAGSSSAHLALKSQERVTPTKGESGPKKVLPKSQFSDGPSSQEPKSRVRAAKTISKRTGSASVSGFRSKGTSTCKKTSTPSISVSQNEAKNPSTKSSLGSRSSSQSRSNGPCKKTSLASISGSGQKPKGPCKKASSNSVRKSPCRPCREASLASKSSPKFTAESPCKKPSALNPKSEGPRKNASSFSITDSKSERTSPCKTTSSASKSEATSPCKKASASKSRGESPCKKASASKSQGKSPCKKTSSASISGSKSDGTSPCKTTSSASKSEATSPCKKASASKSRGESPCKKAAASKSQGKSPCKRTSSASISDSKSDGTSPCKTTSSASKSEATSPCKKASASISRGESPCKKAAASKSQGKSPCKRTSSASISGSKSGGTSPCKTTSSASKSEATSPCQKASASKSRGESPCKKASAELLGKSPCKKTSSASISDSKSDGTSPCKTISSASKSEATSPCKKASASKSRGESPCKKASAELLGKSPCKKTSSASISGSKSGGTSPCKTTSSASKSEATSPCQKASASKSRGESPCKKASAELLGKSPCKKTSSASISGSKSDGTSLSQKTFLGSKTEAMSPFKKVSTSKLRDESPCKAPSASTSGLKAEETSTCKKASSAIKAESSSLCKKASSPSKSSSKSEGTSLCRKTSSVSNSEASSPCKKASPSKLRGESPCKKSSSTSMLDTKPKSNSPCKKASKPDPCKKTSSASLGGSRSKNFPDCKSGTKPQIKCGRPLVSDTSPKCKKASPISKCGSMKSGIKDPCKTSSAASKCGSKKDTPSASIDSKKACKRAAMAKCGSQKYLAKDASSSTGTLQAKASHGCTKPKCSDYRCPSCSTTRDVHTLTTLLAPFAVKINPSTRNYSRKHPDNPKNINKPDSAKSNEYSRESCEKLSWKDTKHRKERRNEPKNCYPEETQEFCPDTACYKASKNSKKGNKKPIENEMGNYKVLCSTYNFPLLMSASQRCHQSTNARINQKAIIEAPYKISMQSHSIPRISDNDILVAVDSVALSDSDIYMFETGARHYQDVTLGNEAAGVVQKIGRNVHHVKIGDHVAIESAIPCRRCDLCKKGHYNLCNRLTFNGCLSKYCIHPGAFCYKISKEIPMELAAMAYQLALGCNVSHQARIKPNSNVAIIGSCAMTVCAAICAHSMGASNICVMCGSANTENIIEKFVTEKVGCFDGKVNESLLVEKMLESLGTLPDIIINCSSCTKTMNAAIMALKPTGTCVIAGFHSECASFNIMDALMKEIRIIPSYRSKNMFPLAINLLESGRAPIDGLVANCYRWDELEDAFRVALSEGNSGPRKVVVHCQMGDGKIKTG